MKVFSELSPIPSAEFMASDFDDYRQWTRTFSRVIKSVFLIHTCTPRVHALSVGLSLLPVSYHLLTASVQSFRRVGASFPRRRGPDPKVQCHNVVVVVVIVVVVVVVVVVHLQRIVS
jgi:uncharacterized membrane protein YidH (DUF202 family)